MCGDDYGWTVNRRFSASFHPEALSRPSKGVAGRYLGRAVGAFLSFCCSAAGVYFA